MVGETEESALRLLMLVGLETEHLVTIEEVADRFGISKNHLMKVAYEPGQAGYLETVRGRKRRVALGKGAKPDCGGGSCSKDGTGLRGSRMPESGGLLQDYALLCVALCNARSCPGFSRETRSIHPRGPASAEI
jgi:hypothetical protein